jgi:hypothetical protein
MNDIEAWSQDWKRGIVLRTNSDRGAGVNEMKERTSTNGSSIADMEIAD